MHCSSCSHHVAQACEVYNEYLAGVVITKDTCHPCNPDFNPIEKAFSKLKAFFARLPQALSKAFGPQSENSSPPSRQLNAQTTSPQQDMVQFNRIPL